MIYKLVGENDFMYKMSTFTHEMTSRRSFDKSNGNSFTKTIGASEGHSKNELQRSDIKFLRTTITTQIICHILQYTKIY